MIPYTDQSAHCETDFCTARRIKETIAFVHPEDVRGWILDVGEPNCVGRQLEAHFSRGTWINTLPTDLNWEVTPALSVDFDTVFCLEVLEHIVNSGVFLRKIWYRMKRGGALYVSTPIHNRLGFMFNETCHFHELKVDAVRTLLEYSSFTPTDFKVFKSIPMLEGYRHGAGLVRGTLRMLTQETQLWRAVK